MSAGSRNALPPGKLHYRPSEVCELTDTQPYVLKFWEQEFPQLASERNRTGQRLYRKKDVDLVRGIKYLLYEKEYTIAAVRKAIESGDLDDALLASADSTGADAPAARASAGSRAGVPAHAGMPEAAPSHRAHRGNVVDDLSGLLFDRPAPAAATPEASQAGIAPPLRPSSGSADLNAEIGRLNVETAELAGRLQTELDRVAADRGRLAAERDQIAAERDAAAAERDRIAAESASELARLSAERDRAANEATLRIARNGQERGKTESRLASEVKNLRQRLERARAEIKDLLSIIAPKPPLA